jgi:DNA-binding transcriptional regulator GbsR (MarR family)
LFESLEISSNIASVIMQIKEAKGQFIEAWGTLGSNWGINRAMAQIHALLLISTEALSTEDVMEELNMSRGSANTNLRMLMDWGLVEKRLKLGERREFFLAEKDIWKVFTKIVYERRKRELEPLRKLLIELRQVKTGSTVTDEERAFMDMIASLDDFSATADKVLGKMIQSEEFGFLESLSKLMKLTGK